MWYEYWDYLIIQIVILFKASLKYVILICDEKFDSHLYINSTNTFLKNMQIIFGIFFQTLRRIKRTLNNEQCIAIPLRQHNNKILQRFQYVNFNQSYTANQSRCAWYFTTFDQIDCIREPRWLKNHRQLTAGGIKLHEQTVYTLHLYPFSYSLCALPSRSLFILTLRRPCISHIQFTNIIECEIHFRVADNSIMRQQKPNRRRFGLTEQQQWSERYSLLCKPNGWIKHTFQVRLGRRLQGMVRWSYCVLTKPNNYSCCGVYACIGNTLRAQMHCSSN